VQSARESARRSSCSSNLRQASQGVLGFENAHGRFPALDYDYDLRDMLVNANKLNTHVWYWVGPLFHILPFTDEVAMYDRAIEDWLRGSPNPGLVQLSCEEQPKAYLCPSDPVSTAWRTVDKTFVGLTSYHVCQGDGFEHAGFHPAEDKRGVFRYGKVGPAGTPGTPGHVPEQQKVTTMAHVLDGISNTVMLGEVAIFDGTDRFLGGIGNRATPTLSPGNRFNNSGAETPATCLAMVNGDGRYAAFQTGVSSGVPGWRWRTGSERAVAFSTISAPNTPRCGQQNGNRLVPASSHHISGAFASMCDGSIRWVGDDIDDSYPAGLNYSIYRKGPSYFGVWGSLGTIAGGELMDADRYR
jgi:hypothetical protein